MNSTERTIDFPRFGSLSFRDDEVIAFPWGIPGFSHLRRWVVLSLSPSDAFLWLQSLDDLGVAMPVCDPWKIFEDYAPKLPAYAIESLALEGTDDFAILGVVIVTKNASEMTMNLLAPVIINLKTLTGRQVTLEHAPYSVREPIPRMPNLGGSPTLEEPALS